MYSHILKIMRWTTSLWEEFLMMNYTLLLLLLLKMKRIFQLSLWLMVTKRKGFVWRLLHHIFAMSMKSCKPSCPFYIFLPLFMNCCVSRWEIRTVVRPVIEQVSSFSYDCFDMLLLMMFCDGFARSKMDLLVPWMESWLWNSWQGVPVGTDTPWEEYLFHPPYRQVVHASMNYLRGVFEYGGSNKVLWCTVLWCTVHVVVWVWWINQTTTMSRTVRYCDVVVRVLCTVLRCTALCCTSTSQCLVQDKIVHGTRLTIIWQGQTWP